MKYLKKWSIYLEDFEIGDTDTSDIKMAKEYNKCFEFIMKDRT